MTIEEAMEQVNFSVSGVSVEEFKNCSESVYAFESAVRNLSALKKDSKFRKEENIEFYIKAKLAYQDLSSLALMNVSESLLAEYEIYSQEFADVERSKKALADRRRQRASKCQAATKHIFVDLALLVLVCVLEFLAVYLFDRYLHVGYFLLLTPLLWLLYSFYTEQIEYVDNVYYDRRITIIFKVVANIINAGLLTTYIFVFTNPASLGWTIAMLVVNTIITIVISLPIIFEMMEEIFDREMILCDWRVIVFIIGYLAIAVSYVLNKELIDYYCHFSSFWHTLWVLPVVQIAMALVVHICWKFYQHDLDGQFVSFVVPIMAIVNFIRAMVVVWAWKFNVGMFFFGVLALVIQAVAFLGTLFISGMFGALDK